MGSVPNGGAGVWMAPVTPPLAPGLDGLNDMAGLVVPHGAKHLPPA